MDGYALYVDESTAVDGQLVVSQRIPAGQVGSPLEAGTCARIFTGAEVPPGVNSVIMQEQVEDLGTAIRLTRVPRVGENIREAGQDIARGSTVVAAGTRLTNRR